MATPALTIELSARGINRVVVHTGRGDQSSAFDLLQQVFPALKELDQCVLRKSATPRRAQNGSMS